MHFRSVQLVAHKGLTCSAEDALPPSATASLITPAAAIAGVSDLPSLLYFPLLVPSPGRADGLCMPMQHYAARESTAGELKVGCCTHCSRRKRQERCMHVVSRFGGHGPCWSSPCSMWPLTAEKVGQPWCTWQTNVFTNMLLLNMNLGLYLCKSNCKMLVQIKLYLNVIYKE